MTEEKIDQAICDLLADGRERKVAFVIAKVAEATGRDNELLRVEAALKRLMAEGKLEARGDASDWRHSEVRLIA